MSAAAPRADRVRLTPETHEALFAEALRRIDPKRRFPSITAAMQDEFKGPVLRGMARALYRQQQLAAHPPFDPRLAAANDISFTMTEAP